MRTIICLSLLMLIGWQPNCALAADPPPRWKLLLEIDRMAGTTPIPLEQTIGGRRVSLVEIFAAAGVQLRVVNGSEIRRKEELARSELHGLMNLAAGQQPLPGEIKIKLLIVNQELGRTGLYGVMFDYGQFNHDGIQRQGLAVFEAPHRSLAAGVVPEMLLTIAHELTHIFNLHHSDWDGLADYEHGATIEGYSFVDSVQWKLSAASVDHLLNQSCPETLVRPGVGGLAFGLISSAHAGQHRAPFDFYSVVRESLPAGRRASGSSSPQLGAAAERAGPRFELSLAVPKTEYVIGEAITLTAALVNKTGEKRDVFPLIDPEYRALTLTVKGPGDDLARPYLPPFLLDARAYKAVTLAPDESLITEAKIFFGAEGWNFQEAGEYLIEATYPPAGPASSEFVASAPLRIVVREPVSVPSRRARELLSVEGTLQTEHGLYLYMQGGSASLQDSEARLKQILKEAPNAEQAADIQVALASDAQLPVEPGAAVSVARLREAITLLRSARASVRIAPTALLRTQASLADALEKAGLNAEATAERAAVRQQLQEEVQIRALDRGSMQERL